MTRFLSIPLLSIAASAMACASASDPAPAGPVAAAIAQPLAAHGAEAACDPDLNCGDALTCIDGLLYPSTCGPANCDAPISACPKSSTCEGPPPPCPPPGPDCVAVGGGCIDGTWRCPNVTCTEPPAQPICGPVRWDGEGHGATHDEAFSAARKSAVQACETTPSLCFVDCLRGRVVSAGCGPTAVQPADGSEPAVTWQCNVVLETVGE